MKTMVLMNSQGIKLTCKKQTTGYLIQEEESFVQEDLGCQPTNIWDSIWQAAANSICNFKSIKSDYGEKFTKISLKVEIFKTYVLLNQDRYGWWMNILSTFPTISDWETTLVEYATIVKLTVYWYIK